MYENVSFLNEFDIVDSVYVTFIVTSILIFVIFNLRFLVFLLGLKDFFVN